VGNAASAASIIKFQL